MFGIGLIATKCEECDFDRLKCNCPNLDLIYINACIKFCRNASFYSEDVG